MSSFSPVAQESPAAEIKKERSPYWDNARAALMFLVVIAHLAESACDFSGLCRAFFVDVYSFHMPAFIFIAGLFHTNKKTAEKTVSYLGAYLISKIIFFLLQAAFGKSPSFVLLKESGLPWFMFAMAAFTVLTYLVRNIPPVYVLVIALIAGCFSGYDSSIGDFLVLSRILVFFPFYYLGTMCRREKLESIAKKPASKLLGLSIVLLWTAVCFLFTDKVYLLRPLFTGRNAFTEGMRPFGFLLRIAVYLITVLVGSGFLLLMPTGPLGIVTKWGTCTLQIYLWHMVIIKTLISLGLFANVFSKTRPMLLLWLLLSIPIFMVSALPIFSFPMKQIMAPAHRK